jgi:hypothetical protein
MEKTKRAAMKNMPKRYFEKISLSMLESSHAVGRDSGEIPATFK